MNDGMMEPPMA